MKKKRSGGVAVRDGSGADAAKKLARRIARDLFTYGGDAHDHVQRLVMQFPEPAPILNGPGWGERAVADRIEKALLRAKRAGAQRRKPPRPRTDDRRDG